MFRDTVVPVHGKMATSKLHDEGIVGALNPLTARVELFVYLFDLTALHERVRSSMWFDSHTADVVAARERSEHRLRIKGPTNLMIVRIIYIVEQHERYVFFLPARLPYQ